MVDITNVVTVSVSQPARGLGAYNVNALMLFTEESPIVAFGSDEYRSYVSPKEVATDWGTSSKTYQCALAIFAQSPNVLAGNGQLQVAPILSSITHDAVAATGTITFTANPTVGSTFTIGSVTYTFSSSAGTNQIVVGTSLAGTLTNIAAETYASTTCASNGTDVVTFTASTAGVAGNSIALACNDAAATVSGASLSGGADAYTAAETLSEALNRISALVYFSGILCTKDLGDTEAENASDVVQTMDSIFILPSYEQADLTQTSGLLYKIWAKNNYKTKPFYFALDGTFLSALQAAAAYMGRCFSVNFSAQNSTITMNLKDLNTILPDTTINQTIYNRLATLGVDTYTDYDGLPKVVSNAINALFFDSVYNELWFTLTAKVTMFNALARTSTKIPQTIEGMNYLKNAMKTVCEQAVYNRFLAPGTWNSSEWFGNQEDFARNIASYGYYIYALPVTQQSQLERESRIAPVIQVAGKMAGAIHKANIIVVFEA